MEAGAIPDKNSWHLLIMILFEGAEKELLPIKMRLVLELYQRCSMCTFLEHPFSPLTYLPFLHATIHITDYSLKRSTVIQTSASPPKIPSFTLPHTSGAFPSFPCSAPTPHHIITLIYLRFPTTPPLSLHNSSKLPYKTMLFTLFVVALAAFWAFIGLRLAQWLKQSGHSKPFKGRQVDIYGGGLGYGRDMGIQAQAREYRGLGRGGDAGGMKGYGEGKIKGV